MSRQAFDPGTERPGSIKEPATPLAVPEPTDRSLVVALQRSAGNAVVQRYLDGRTSVARVLHDGEPVVDTLERRAGGGHDLEHGMRGALESSFGASLSRARVHTGPEATRLARSVNAVAFTYGQDMYFRAGAYDTGSETGRHLIAHEAAHVLQQAGGSVPSTAGEGGVPVSTPGDTHERAADRAATAFTSGDRAMARLSLEPTVRGIQRVEDSTLEMRYEEQQGDASKSKTGTARSLSWMTMKRKHIHLTGDDKYGHWWTEMDGSESYGWWPKYPVGGIWDTLTGVEGELNGQTSFGGTATTDPHHGDSAEDTFSPTYSGALTDDQIRDEVRKHATGYSGSWRWTFGFGQNCHTFQKAMMAKIGLVEP